MTESFRVFVVDDSDAHRMLLASIFEDRFSVETFSSSEVCLKHLNAGAARPDIFLLDVEMPGMDGYEFCRVIKANPETATIPVLFISAHTDVESRLQGYDCGGEDFIAKPFDAAEVCQKVDVVRKIQCEQSALALRLAESDLLSSLIMSNLDEYAVLIKFLKQLNDARCLPEVAENILSLFKAYGLQGAVQVRSGHQEVTLSESGENRPLEVAVMTHLRTHARIFEFQRRLVINFDAVSAMVNDMPADDPERRGRLRDHLAIAVESANTRCSVITLLSDAKQRTRDELAGILEEVTVTVGQFSKSYDEARCRGTLLSTEMVDDLTQAFAALALTSEREEQILDIVRLKAHHLIDLYDFGDQTLLVLKHISSQLGVVLQRDYQS